MSQTAQMPRDFTQAINELDEESFQLLYGGCDPLLPAEVAELLAGTGVRWYVAGGRAARVGAAPRHHDDTDIVVRLDDLAALRQAMAGWHLWEAHDGALRPLLPGFPATEHCEQLWARQDARHPWQLDLLLDRASDDAQWVFKRDASVCLPWARALHHLGGIAYLRPEVALLHKARLDRPKDRADLAAAALEPEARAWLAATLRHLGHDAWAAAVGRDELPPQA
jgi:hypothetical protein